MLSQKNGETFLSNLASDYFIIELFRNKQTFKGTFNNLLNITIIISLK